MNINKNCRTILNLISVLLIIATNFTQFTQLKNKMAINFIYIFLEIIAGKPLQPLSPPP